MVRRAWNCDPRTVDRQTMATKKNRKIGDRLDGLVLHTAKLVQTKIAKCFLENSKETTHLFFEAIFKKSGIS